jgi:integrase
MLLCLDWIDHREHSCCLNRRRHTRLQSGMDRRLHRAAAGERGSPFTTAGWRKMVARLGVAAKLGFKAQPHMFRHARGFQLAN